MVNAYLARLQALVFGPDRRKARLAVWGICLLAALVVAAYVAALGPLYALAGVIALIGGTLMITSIQWGLYALIGIVCLLPFATFPFKIGFTPTFLDAALVVLFFVWLARLATGREQRFDASPIGLLVLLFVGLALATFARGLTHARLTPTALRHFIEIILGISLFFLVVNNVRRLSQVESLMRVLLLAGFGAAVIGIAFYTIPEAWTVRILNALGRFGYPGGYGALRYIEDNPTNPMRAIGTSVDPNVLGGLMILVTAVTAPQIAARFPLLPRRWIAVMLAAEGLCLYLTYSRGSLIGLAAALFLLGLVRYRRLLLVMIIGGGLLLLLPQAQTYVAHLLAGLRGQDRATQMRFGEYKDALRLISEYPWFGVGFVGTPRIDLYIGVSNLYLLIAEEMGLVGLSAFLLAMASFFWQLVKAWRRGLPERVESIVLGLGGAVFGGLVGGIFDHYLFNLTYPHMTSLFWFYIGLAMAVLRVVERREGEGRELESSRPASVSVSRVS